MGAESGRGEERREKKEEGKSKDEGSTSDVKMGRSKSSLATFQVRQPESSSTKVDRPGDASLGALHRCLRASSIRVPKRYIGVPEIGTGYVRVPIYKTNRP